MIRPENETENLPLSFTKKCEMPIEQIYKKPEETLELNLPKQEKHSISNHQVHLKDLG